MMSLPIEFQTIDLNMIPIQERIQLLRELEALDEKRKGRKIDTVFSTEELRRGYHKHIEFFNAGAGFNQRLFLGGNRVGKTVVGAYEIACHLTGVYPDWWKGRKFNTSIDVWVAGDISKTVRDIIQKELIGELDDPGTGMIPRDAIGSMTKAMGTSGYLDTVEIKSAFGGWSRVQFKSYDQGRKAFQGTNKQIIWLDEEVSSEIYQECLLRTMTTNGMMLLTFTPLMGMTELVQQFMKADESTGKKTVTITWDDAPHLSKSQKDLMFASLPPHQRDARSKGIPSLGSGSIYPVPESEFMVQPFEIPKHWKRLYALDVGWNNTAAVWLARDPDSGVSYIYSEYKQGEERPLFHADSIKGRGKWIPGVIDPAARGRGQDDGMKLIDQYREHGLKLDLAINSVEAGIYAVWEGLSTGKLKVFNNLVKFQDEFRLYHRDEKGHIVKKHDHVMDCVRYAYMTKDKAGVEFTTQHNPSDFYQVNQHTRTTL